jgi:hypothetical protein
MTVDRFRTIFPLIEAHCVSRTTLMKPEIRNAKRVASPSSTPLLDLIFTIQKVLSLNVVNCGKFSYGLEIKIE